MNVGELFSFVCRWFGVRGLCKSSVSCDKFFQFCSMSVSSFRLQLRYLEIFVKSAKI